MKWTSMGCSINNNNNDNINDNSKYNNNKNSNRRTVSSTYTRITLFKLIIHFIKYDIQSVVESFTFSGWMNWLIVGSWKLELQRNVFTYIRLKYIPFRILHIVHVSTFPLYKYLLKFYVTPFVVRRLNELLFSFHFWFRIYSIRTKLKYKFNQASSPEPTANGLTFPQLPQSQLSHKLFAIMSHSVQMGLLWNEIEFDIIQINYHICLLVWQILMIQWNIKVWRMARQHILLLLLFFYTE